MILIVLMNKITFSSNSSSWLEYYLSYLSSTTGHNIFWQQKIQILQQVNNKINELTTYDFLQCLFIKFMKKENYIVV